MRTPLSVSTTQEPSVRGKERVVHRTQLITKEPVNVTDATFREEVLHSAVPVLLDCWAPWCGPCQRMGPVMHALAEEMVGQVKVAKLNVDENPVVSRQLGIQSIPTILLFRSGAIIDQMMGAVPKEELQNAVLSRLQEQ